jgi:phage terminase small subunit
VTPKQKRFVAAYEGNATEAALKAGYSKKTAYAQGQRMLKNVEVKAAIKAREDKRVGKIIAPREERQTFWSSIMRNKKAKMFDRLRASELLGKSEGDFLDKVQVGGFDGKEIVVQWRTSP